MGFRLLLYVLLSVAIKKNHKRLVSESVFGGYRLLKTKSTFVIFVVLLLAMRSACAGWTFISEVEDVEVYVDQASLVRTRQTAKLPVMLSYRDGRTVHTRFFSSVDVVEFHCEKLLLRRLSMKNFTGLMGEGVQVYSVSDAGAWLPVNLFGLEYELRKRACAVAHDSAPDAVPQSNNG